MTQLIVCLILMIVLPAGSFIVLGWFSGSGEDGTP